MKTIQSTKAKSSSTVESATTLGEFAHQVIQHQYESILKLEPKVLADRNPEHLHRMRVATRRLRTALQIFSRSIKLPKIAQPRQIADLARSLGALRDLDVQIADLQTNYRPHLTPTEQSLLDQAIAALHQERHKALASTRHALTRSRYQRLKDAYQTWLNTPEYTALAQLPLLPLLPDLLSPLLAELLLHPGWLVQTTQFSPASDQTLHDLRKAAKHARYQTEFFAPLYPSPFQQWLEEMKAIQEVLGQLHDGQVLLDLIEQHLPKRAKLPKLQALIEHKRAETMQNWEPKRQQFLNPGFRHQIHQLLLEYERPL